MVERVVTCRHVMYRYALEARFVVCDDAEEIPVDQVISLLTIP